MMFPGKARPDAGGRDGAAGLCGQHDGECLPRLRLPHQDLWHGLALCPHQHLPDLHIRPQQVRILLLLSVISHSFLRFIPLVVVIFRMLMVCHVDFCHKHGEKVIRDQLLRYMVYVSNNGRAILAWSFPHQDLLLRGGWRLCCGHPLPRPTATLPLLPRQGGSIQAGPRLQEREIDYASLVPSLRSLGPYDM